MKIDYIFIYLYQNLGVTLPNWHCVDTMCVGLKHEFNRIYFVPQTITVHLHHVVTYTLATNNLGNEEPLKLVQ